MVSLPQPLSQDREPTDNEVVFTYPWSPVASASVSAVTVYNATLEFFRGDVLISSGCLADWNAWKRWAAPTLDCASFLLHWSVDYSFWVVWCRLWLQITTFSIGNRGKCSNGKSEHDIAFQTFQVTKEPFGYFSYRLCQIVWSSISYLVCKNSLISWKIYITLKFLSFPTEVKKGKTQRKRGTLC